MQVVACMPTESPPLPPASARQRLLDAATQVFSREGLAGSTPREIARVAGVNEVTLFRHFHTKEGLISAVVGQNFGPPILSQPVAATPDLRADLQGHARRYETLLRQNLPLIRTMLGEIHHHADHERQVFQAIFRPLREALLARLEGAVREGRLRAGTNPGMLADQFGAMLFTGVLRRSSPHLRIEYSAEEHLQGVVDLIVGGAGLPPGQA